MSVNGPPSVVGAVGTGRGLTPTTGRFGSIRAGSSPWLAFLLRRAFSLLVILVVLVTLSFLMVRLIPGDPGAIVAGISATQAQIDQVRHELGVDQPLLTQYVNYWVGLFHGDLGQSFQSHQPVTQLIQQRVGTSLQLAAAALVMVLLLSIPGGMLAGAFTRESRHRRVEVGYTAVTSVIGAIPEYLAGTFLAFVFAVALRWLPVAGSDDWQALILPTLAISLRPIAILSRLVRVETLNVLAADYIRTARSKRLPARLIYLRHALPNVITAALTIGGILFAGIIGGAVVVENVFARPGLGTALVSAVLARDYPVIQGLVLVLGVTVVVVNAIVDILLAVVDPRSMTRQV